MTIMSGRAAAKQRARRLLRDALDRAIHNDPERTCVVLGGELERRLTGPEMSALEDRLNRVREV